MNKPANINPVRVAELLVILSAALAILLAVNHFAQKSARDAKRISDIQSIASTLELNYDNRGSSYEKIEPGMFKTGTLPKDPQQGIRACNSRLCTYCFRDGGGFCSDTDRKLADFTPSPKFTVCANLESGGYFCRSSQR